LFDDVVAPGCGYHLLVVDVDQARDFSDCGSGTAQLIGMDNFWDIIFIQQPGQGGLGRFGVRMPLEENALHDTVLFHGPPKPMSNAVYAHPHLVEMPSGFPVAQVFSEKGSELDPPFTEGAMTHLLSRAEHFLHVPVTQGKSVVQPEGVLGNDYGEAVAVGLGVGHGGLACPDPVKATQSYRGSGPNTGPLPLYIFTEFNRLFSILT